MVTRQGVCRSVVIAVAIVLVSLNARPATAQSYFDSGSLPSPGSTVRVGDLRTRFAPANAVTGEPTGPAWLFGAGVDISEAFTDNPAAGSGEPGAARHSSDLITTISPTIDVSGDTRRAHVNFSYSPQALIYAEHSSPDEVLQNFAGTGHVALVPETMFIDLTAFGGLQSRTGTSAGLGYLSQNTSDLVQTYGVTVAPYVQHRFGSAGLGELGYSVSYASNGNVTNNLKSRNDLVFDPTLDQFVAQRGAADASNVLTQSEHAAFTSGEDFGRVNMRVAARATQYSGSALYDGAYSDLATIDLGYAINRTIAAIGRIGYEDIQYPRSVPPLLISDVVWAVGGKLTPNPDSTITATFGHRFGQSNVFVDGAYSVTARLRVFARYSQTLSTGLQDLQDTLGQIDVDSSGAIYDRATGSPIAVVDSFFGVNDTLSRLNRGSVNAILIYARDTFSVAVVHQAEKVIGMAPDSVGASSTQGTYGTLTWEHALNPALSITTFLQYGVNNRSSVNNAAQTIYAGTISLSYALSPTLSVRALYSYDRNPAVPGQKATENYALIGLSKRF
jgi:uncharacterized protein (PEP-CTERM system associated)